VIVAASVQASPGSDMIDLSYVVGKWAAAVPYYG
jgi:hypothetical protein